MSHSLSHKVQFLFVVLLGSFSTSQVEWAQQTWVEGEGSPVQHHSEKEVKTCFLFWPGWLLARIFNREPWAQGISENSYSCQTAQGWPEPPVGTVVGESKGHWRVLSVHNKKLIFSFFLKCHQAHCLCIDAAPTVWGGLLQSGTITGRSISDCYQEQELLWKKRAEDDAEFFREISFWPVLERASCLGNSKPYSIRDWFGGLGGCFLGAF